MKKVFMSYIVCLLLGVIILSVVDSLVSTCVLTLLVGIGVSSYIIES